MTHNLWHSQIGGIIQGKACMPDRRRENGFGVGTFMIVTSFRLEMSNTFGICSNEKIVEGVKEVKRIVASKGKSAVEGKVHILLDPNNLADFQDGEILVAP